MTLMVPTIQSSTNTVRTMSQFEWSYVCVLARHAELAENRFEAGPDAEYPWAHHDDCIFTKMYNSEYCYRLLDDEHDVLLPPESVTIDRRKHVNDVITNFVEVRNARMGQRRPMQCTCASCLSIEAMYLRMTSEA